MLDQKTTLNGGGQIIDLSEPIVMGILNLTPDSFFDGGKHHSETLILQQCEKMLQEGAQILDIGGASSRPGALAIAPEAELKRVLPAIKAIKKAFPQVLLSIDTYWSAVAKATVAEGVNMVNDISGGQLDAELWPTLAKLEVPYVLMHMQGSPKDMQMNPVYEDIGTEVFDFFTAKIAHLRSLGIKDLLLDPGFGFGKTIDHNFKLLNTLPAFQVLELPLLVGISRKSMIYKTLDVSASEALNGSTALHMVALQNGAKILRVHDVKEAVETIALWKKLEANKGSNQLH